MRAVSLYEVSVPSTNEHRKMVCSDETKIFESFTISSRYSPRENATSLIASIWAFACARSDRIWSSCSRCTSDMWLCCERVSYSFSNSSSCSLMAERYFSTSEVNSETLISAASSFSCIAARSEYSFTLLSWSGSMSCCGKDNERMAHMRVISVSKYIFSVRYCLQYREQILSTVWRERERERAIVPGLTTK